MDVGIIGTGNVGRALADGLSAAGHDVVVGSRTPGDASVPAGRLVGVSEAAAHGEVVVLAVPAGAAPTVAADLGDALAGKVLVDAANEYPTATADRSLAARVAAAAPEATVVKAFNTVGANRLTAPVVDGEPVTMFVAGDDATATATVASLAADLGFDPLVAGDLAAAEHLEHLARFWIHLSREEGRDIGFRLLAE